MLYGSVSGLTATGSQQFTQDTTGIGDNEEEGDHFGATLAAGDFDISAAPELVVGVPDEDLGAATDAGIVQVLQGTASGLTGTGSQTWSQTAAGIADNAEAGDRFGSALAVGDLGGSADDDLAIGVPEEDGTATVDDGVVHILLGAATGLTATGSTLWSQNDAGIGDTAESGDGFGASLAIGDSRAASPATSSSACRARTSARARTRASSRRSAAAAGPTGTGSQTFGQGTPGRRQPGDGRRVRLRRRGRRLRRLTSLDLAVGAPGESGTSRRTTASCT